MGVTNEINKFEELLQQHFEKDITILDTKTKSLTSAGDNYGSQMLAIEVKFLRDGSAKEETINVVAKMCPPNEYLKVVFDSPFTFKKEIAAYSTIFPTLTAFQKQQGTEAISFFPESCGTRLSLDLNATIADDDAVLLLENLKLLGFEVVNRMQGFDLQTTELLLKDLAVFHAVPIALKLLEPEVFDEKIRPNLLRTPVFDTLSENGLKACIDFIVDTVKLDPVCGQVIPRIIKAMRQGFHDITNPAAPREPFATISHNDYWVNNTMLKFENNNPVENKMLDFQIINYGSPGNDIVFFLFSSVQTQIVKQHYNRFIKLYYEQFINTLKTLKCDTSSFTFEKLEEEISTSAKTTEFFHVAVMVRTVFAIKDKVKEISEITEKDFVERSQVSDKCAERVIATVLHFVEKGWI